MKNKFISFIISAALVLVPCIVHVSAAKTELTKSASESLKMLTSLGIVDSSDETDIPSAIPRDMAVSYAVKLLENVNTDNFEKTYFVDVGSENEYLPYINAAYEHGVIKGAENSLFMPKNTMKKIDFAVCLLRIAGYGEYMSTAGVQKTAVLKRNMLSGTVGTADDALTLNDMYIMMANALKLPSMNVSGMNAVNSESDIIYEKNDDVLVMTELLDIKKYNGIIVSTSDVALGSRSLANGDDTVVLLDDGSEKTFSCNVLEYRELIGFRVNIYAKKDGSDILYAEKDGTSAKDFTIDGDNIIGVPQTLKYISYSNDSKTSVKSANFDSSTVFVYNGRMCFEVTANDIKNNADVVRIADFDSDGVYDIVYIWNYSVVYVQEVSSYQKSVIDKFTMNEIFLDGDSDEYDVEIYIDGNPGQFSKIRQGSTLTVAVSKGGNAGIKKTVYVTNNDISGIVKSINEKRGSIQIDSKEYKVSVKFSFDNVKLGTNSSFAVDYFGKIACKIEDITTNVNYGYLLAAKKFGNLDETLKLRIYTSDGVLCDYSVAEKFKYNATAGDMDAVCSALIDADNGTNQQLVSYELNSKNEIVRLNTATAVSGIPTSEPSNTLTLNAVLKASDTIPHRVLSNYLGGQYIATNKTVVFMVSNDANGKTGESGVKIISLANEFSDKTDAQMEIYDADYMRTPGAVVVYKGQSANLMNVRIRKIPVIIESISEEITESGDIGTVLHVYERTDKGYSMAAYTVAPELDMTDLKTGTCITFTQNSKGEIDDYYIKFAVNKPSGYNDTTGVFADGEYSDVVPAIVGVEGLDVLTSSVAIYGKLLGRTTAGSNRILVNIEGTAEQYVYGVGSAATCPAFIMDINKDSVKPATWTDLQLDSDVFVFTKSGIAVLMLSITNYE